MVHSWDARIPIEASSSSPDSACLFTQAWEDIEDISSAWVPVFCVGSQMEFLASDLDLGLGLDLMVIWRMDLHRETLSFSVIKYFLNAAKIILLGLKNSKGCDLDCSLGKGNLT